MADNMNTSPPSISPEGYDNLTPDEMLNAVESLGLISDMRILPLNSYENRVYQVGIEPPQDEEKVDPIIAKFYRPLRWSDEQIQEEHDFTNELADADIPVIAPLVHNGKTVHDFHGYRFSLYPRRGGYSPDLDNPDNLLMLGRFLGRIHTIGSQKPFMHRPTITLEEYVIEPSRFILENDFVAPEMRSAYEQIIEAIQKHLAQHYQLDSLNLIRLHGDFHPGNILWRDENFYFVDFDDCRMGPAVQDLWMMLSGERHQRIAQLSEILEGYEEFCSFDKSQLSLIEPLRAMRMIHYAGWLAKRWNDPAFPHNFPWFNTPTYWGEHVLQLKEQLSELQEPPLALYP